MIPVIKQLLRAPLEIWLNRHILYDLTRSDFRNHYLGSYLGSFWAFINPLVTIAVFVFVFQVGFKAAPIGNIPFVVWLSSGIIPWFYLAEGISQGSMAIISYSFLVKKVVFKISLLPLVKILSAIMIHLFFLFLLMVILVYYQFYPSLYWLQLPYYLACSVILMIGISWLTSSLSVFTRDVNNIIGVFIQLGFWMTPIFWNIKIVPAKYARILKLNPTFYIIQGYRDTFIYDIWFWQHETMTVYFWSFTIISFFLGLYVFRKLKPHFADVL